MAVKQAPYVVPHTNDNVPMTSTRNKTNPTQEQRTRILGKLELGAETLVRPTTPAPTPSPRRTRSVINIGCSVGRAGVS